MSSSTRRFEADQELTKFSLSLAKKIFARTGITPVPTSSSSVPSNNLSPSEIPIKIDLVTSALIKSSPSPLKSPNSNTISDNSNNNYGSPVVRRAFLTHQESILISVEGTPINEERSVRKGSSEQFDDTGVSYYSDQEDQSSYQMPSVSLVTREEFSNRLQKEGWLEKKSSSMFLGWQKRYFRFKAFEISYAKTPEMLEARQDVRSVNLKAYVCEVTAGKDNTFNIAVDKVQKKLNLKAESLREAIEWIDFLKEFFSYAKSHCYQDNKYHSQSKARLSKLDMMTEETFLQGADTGDIIIFVKGQVKQSKSSNKYEHVAMVAQISGEIFLYDAKCEKSVRLTRWKDFKKNQEYVNSKTIIFRRLVIDDPQVKEIIKSRISNYIIARGDVDLIPSMLKGEGSPEMMTKSHDAEMLRANSATLAVSTPTGNSAHILLQTKSKSQNIDEERNHSAHLVASIFKSIGLLDAYRPVSKFTNASFAKEMKLLKGAYLVGEQEIVLLN